ncbi:MAG: PEP-CTERM sorting domain-containing protein [Thiobacillaceae bacterium]
MKKIVAIAAVVATSVSVSVAHADTLASWNFENPPDPIAVNNNPAPTVGTGTASSIGMSNSYNSTTATTTDDVVLGKSSDTGANGLADTSQVWRVRGQTPGNGWSSQAPIGTQGAEFDVSTVGYDAITVSFDWYATTQGEANLQLQYTTDGTTWLNAAINIGANSTLGLAALTNSTSPNTVTGSYISDNLLTNGSKAGQDWFQGLTATISDSAAANDPNFGIRLVNASTGADDVSTQGTALNNSSGNWRFDNVMISGVAAVPEPETYAMMLSGLGLVGFIARRRKKQV